MKPQILSRRKSVGLFRRISDNQRTNQSEIIQGIFSIRRKSVGNLLYPSQIRRNNLTNIRRPTHQPIRNHAGYMLNLSEIRRNIAISVGNPSDFSDGFPTDRAYSLPRDLNIHISLHIPTDFRQNRFFFVGNPLENFTYPRKRTAKNIRAPTKADSDDSRSVGFIKYKAFLLPSSSFIISLSLKSLRFSLQISLSHRRFSTKISQISSTIM